MTLAWILAAMTALAPGRDHSELAHAIDRVVAEDGPIFANDEDLTKTTSLVIAVAFRESSLRNEAVGDSGHSVCAMQIYNGGRELVRDPEACIRKGIEMLRTSMRVDAKNPVAWYAGGPRWRSEQAKRISRDRMNLAARIARETEEP